MINISDLTTSLYQSISDENKPREMKYWHASSLAMCPRTQFYMRAGIPPLQKPGAGKVLRWKAGHLIEEVIRPHLKKQFPNLISNVRFTNEDLDLTGEIDNYDPDSKSLIEIKSVSSHAVKYRKVADTRAHLRDEHQYLNHEYQQAAYVELTKPQYEVEQIVYLYITLDGLLVPYSTPVNEQIIMKVKKRLEILREAWELQTPPQCICLQEDHPLYKSTMQWCEFKEENGCCSIELWKNKNKENQ